jgi:LPS-assembly lipoprotein
MWWCKSKSHRHSGESRNPSAGRNKIPAFAGMTIMVISLLLSGCGFEPMYGNNSASAKAVAVALPNVDIGNIPDRDGQYLRNLLIDRLYTSGRPDAAPYQLKFSPLQKSIVDLGIQKDATATRAQIQISTHMELVDKATNKAVLERDLKTVGAYNLLDDQLATLVSQQNITESILQEMRDDAVTQLSLYFRRKTTAAAP